MTSTAELWAQILPQLAGGAVTTIQLGVIGLAIASIVGLLAAFARLSSWRSLRLVAVGYSDLVRGTPELLQLYLIYFGLAQVGILIAPFQAAAIWLGLFGGAYASEIFRAGILSIPQGQLEAAHALSLAPLSIARTVVLPQALAATLPSLTNFAILLLKASALAYTIGVAELMYRTNLAALATSRTLECYVLAAAIYLVLCLSLSRLASKLEVRAERYR